MSREEGPPERMLASCDDFVESRPFPKPHYRAKPAAAGSVGKARWSPTERGRSVGSKAPLGEGAFRPGDAVAQRRKERQRRRKEERLRG